VLSEPVAWWLPDEPRALEAAARAEPAALSHPKSELGRAMRGIARQLGGVLDQPVRSRFSFWRTRAALTPAKA